MNARTLCLGILELGDASGYEIRKMTQEGRFSHFVDASYGAIYPALALLERGGLVTCREEHHPGRPDRKVYAITPAGRAALVEALGAEPREDVIKSELLFVLRFADLVPAALVRREIDRRISWLGDQIAHMESGCEAAPTEPARFVCGYGIAVYRAMQAFLVENRPAIETVAGSARNLPEAAE